MQKKAALAVKQTASCAAGCGKIEGENGEFHRFEEY